MPASRRDAARKARAGFAAPRAARVEATVETRSARPETLHGPAKRAWETLADAISPRFVSHARARCHRTDGTVAMWIMDSPRLAVDGRCDARVSCGDETSEVRSTRSECRVVGSSRAVAVTDVGRVRVCAYTASRTVCRSRVKRKLPPIFLLRRQNAHGISWRAFARNDDWLTFLNLSFLLFQGKQS